MYLAELESRHTPLEGHEYRERRGVGSMDLGGRKNTSWYDQHFLQGPVESGSIPASASRHWLIPPTTANYALVVLRESRKSPNL
ncbi:hypothetical protein J6590_026985 [Homalodisca vitripennis]|nr:hypothetical protein J6590_026985 [Homalodisca vitripennis]